MTCQDGPLVGAKHWPVSGATVVWPELDGDGVHFVQHTYSADGHWLNSATWVGYESDETIARREAFWDQAYWDEIEEGTERSYV